MAELITLKLDEEFLEDVDDAVHSEGYHSRTEFIRSALRKKLDEIKLKKAILEISHLKGKAKKQVSPEEYERVRRSAIDELSK